MEDFNTNTVNECQLDCCLSRVHLHSDYFDAFWPLFTCLITNFPVITDPATPIFPAITLFPSLECPAHLLTWIPLSSSVILHILAQIHLHFARMSRVQAQLSSIPIPFFCLLITLSDYRFEDFTCPPQLCLPDLSACLVCDPCLFFWT